MKPGDRVILIDTGQWASFSWLIGRTGVYKRRCSDFSDAVWITLDIALTPEETQSLKEHARDGDIRVSTAAVDVLIAQDCI